MSFKDVFLEVASSPLAPDLSPVRIRCRDAGAGPPIVFLHGGWGYDIYPIDRQLATLAARHRVVIPDRTGYGKSAPIDALPGDFHRLATHETLAVLDRLGLDRPVVWGHSDGAVIALLLGLDHPNRVASVVVEATHFYRRKPRSQEFFTGLGAPRDALGAGVVAVLERDHGPRWTKIIMLHSRAWAEIGETATSPTDDFYGGRLSDLLVPALVIHGAKDPRTEPGELEALRRVLPQAPFEVLTAAGHSPHSEPAHADAVTEIICRFAA